MLMTALAACATVVPADNPRHTALATTGLISERQHVDAKSATSGSAGAYRPGMGGALGGLVAGILMSARGTAATAEHTVYRVNGNDGVERVVRSTADIEVGSCVSVYTVAALAGDSIWDLGEASLRKADSCKPAAETEKAVHSASS